MKVALVHDYLNQAGGAERVVGVLHRLFPEAPVYTSIVDRATLWPALRDADIRASWMQRLPGWRRAFRAYFPLYPFVFGGLDLRAYDVVISSSSAFAKGVRVRPGAFHLSYVHTPMRFAWDFERYMAREGVPGAVRTLLRPAMALLRRYDRRTAQRPHQVVGNSTVVAERIRRHWGREPAVIFPPVDVARFPVGIGPGREWLVLSRLAPYKRLDLVIEAFNRLALPLTIIGDGRDRARLEALAGPTITFAGRLPDDVVVRRLAESRGLIMAGEEDFGIAPLEANAAGRPAVCLAAGGALDTVVDGVTGVLFPAQTPEALADAIRRAEGIAWDPVAVRAHAERFSDRRFARELWLLLARAVPALERRGGVEERRREARAGTGERRLRVETALAGVERLSA